MVRTDKGFGINMQLNGVAVVEHETKKQGINIETQVEVSIGDWVNIIGFKSLPEPADLYLEFEMYGFLKAESDTPVVFWTTGAVVPILLFQVPANMTDVALLEVTWYSGFTKIPISTMVVEFRIGPITDKGPSTEHIRVI